MKRLLLLVPACLAALFVSQLHGQGGVPDIAFDANVNFLKTPADVYLGEVAGVATNSRGHVFVYTRTGNPTVGLGNSRLFSHGGSRLFEFDQNGAFVREIGQGIYSFLQAHSAKVDAQDNIWIVDEASNQVVKFGADGRVLMLMGRKPEAITVRLPPGLMPAGGGRGGAPGAGRGAPAGGGRGGAPAAPGAGAAGEVFTRPTDVTWDSEGNIYVADGHGANARVAKFDKNGRYLLTFGARGAAEGQFELPHSIATDARDNIYVADQGNKRIQVFDKDGKFKSQIANIGAPTAICVSRGAHPYIYSAHTGDQYGMDDAAIYKLELDGKIVGKFGKAGKQAKEFGLVNSIDCRNENELYVGELANWRVQRVILKK